MINDKDTPQNIQEKENIKIIKDTSKNNNGEIIEYIFDKKKDKLNDGEFCEIYKAKKICQNKIQNDQEYVLKIHNKEDLSEENISHGSRLLSEINFLSSLNNEHIVKYKNSFEDEKNICLIMEYCNKDSLYSLMKSRKYLEEYEIRYYMFQVLSTLQYLRKQNIVHRNLTLNNIFLKDIKTIKVGDFCFAYNDLEKNEESNIICGTPGYFTPECNNCKYSYKTDIFCFGLCIYYLFGASCLFISPCQSVEFFNHNEEVYFDKKLNFSEEAMDLLKKTITTEDKRIDLDEIYNHPFFNKGIGLTKDKFPEYKEDNNNKNAFKDFIKELKELPHKEGLILTPRKKTRINFNDNFFTSDLQNIMQKETNKKSESLNLNNNNNKDKLNFNSDKSSEESPGKDKLNFNSDKSSEESPGESPEESSDENDSNNDNLEKEKN